MVCKSHFKWCLGYVVRAPMAGDTKKGDWSHQPLKYMLLYFEWMPQDACKHKRKPDPHHNKRSGVEMTNRAGVVFSQHISRNASHTSAVHYTHKHNKLSITKAQQWVKVHRRGHWRAALVLMNWISIRQILKQVEWIKGRCRVREVRRCVFFFLNPSEESVCELWQDTTSANSPFDWNVFVHGGEMCGGYLFSAFELILIFVYGFSVGVCMTLKSSCIQWSFFLCFLSYSAGYQADQFVLISSTAP